MINSSIKEYLMSDVALTHLNTHETKRGIYLSEKTAQSLGYSCGILWKHGIGVEVRFGKCEAFDSSSMTALLDFVKTTKVKSVIIIQDIHRVYNTPSELSLLQEVIERINMGEYPVNIIGITASSKIPEEIERFTYLINFPLPSRNEIRGIIIGQLKNHGITIGNALVERMAEAFNGLIGDEIRLVLNRIVVVNSNNNTSISVDAIEMILKQKKQVIEKAGFLEFVEPSVGIDDVGGLHNLKRWLKDRKDIFANIERAKTYGLKPPKGVLLFGMPGSGKSLTAKITASYYKLPLLRLDMGLIYGQKSPIEAMYRVTQLADAISPCVLWIDELEKALAGSETGASNDVSIKILGLLLTWMQDRTAPVFIIATANDISMIRPETYRDGRIDEKFFLGFLEDDIEQIDQIITIHLRKRLKSLYDSTVKPLDFIAIAKKMKQMVAGVGGRDGAGYTGANMEALVEKVLMERFVNDRPFVDTRDFVRTLNSVKPQHGKAIKQMLKRAEEIEAIHA